MICRPIIQPLVRPMVRSVLEPWVGKGGGTSLKDRVRNIMGRYTSAPELWVDVGDMSTLFQPGMVPVTAVGQTVAFIHDKSGRGNHITFGVPVLLVEDSNGKRALRFVGTKKDGVINLSMLGAQDISLFIGSVAAGNGAYALFENGSIGLAVDGSLGVFIGASAVGAVDPEGIQWRRRGVGTANIGAFGLPPGEGPGRARRKVFSVVNNDARCNGQALSVFSGQVITRTAYADLPTYVGQRTAVGTNPFQGDLYGIVMIGAAVTADEAEVIRQYIDSITGAKTEGVFPAGATVDVLLVTGQSNAEGRGDAAQSPTVPAGTAGSYQGGAIVPLADPVGGAATGSAWPAYANAWHATTGRRLLVVEAATGGSGLMSGVGAGDWSPSGTLRAGAVSLVTAARAALVSQGYVVGNVDLYWQQGEQDATAGITAAEYESAQVALFGYFKANIPGLRRILVSELGEHVTPNANYAVIRGAQNAAVAATEGAHLAFTGAKGFPAAGKMKADGVHYTQAGLNELGDAVADFNAGLL